MKKLQHFCATTILVFALTASAFAGVMDAGRTTPPPPPPATSSGEMDTGNTTPTTSATTAGEMGTGVTSTEETTAAGSLTETVLSLLQSILGLI